MIAISDTLRYTVVLEPTREPEHPGWYYAHIPTLDLTTHGEGIEGAMEAARDLVAGWVAELRAAGREVPTGDASFVGHVEIRGAITDGIPGANDAIQRP